MVQPLKDRVHELFPGLVIAGLVAIAAQFLNEHYGAPAMLMAILLGMPLNFLSEEQRTSAGIAFSARTLLRVGVALLGRPHQCRNGAGARPTVPFAGHSRCAGDHRISH